MLIYLKVKPNQRFDRVERIAGGLSSITTGWQIRLKAPAVDGQANAHLIVFLSEVLDLPKTKIILKKGQTSTIKCVEIMAEESYVLAMLNDKTRNE